MLRLLLDTHAFLWAASDPSQLSRAAFEAINDPSNEVSISAAVAWEITIKSGLGKIRLPTDPRSYLPARTGSMGLRDLPITARHVLAVFSLPPIHRDPFDRIMIAQAQIEDLVYVTRDQYSLRYPVRFLLA